MVIWVTGLSGSGKTTLCNAIRRSVKKAVPELVLLDGDQVRAAFGHDLGHREEDRVVGFKRLQNIAGLLSKQGLTVVVAAVYSNPELLKWNRGNFRDYFEIYLDASIDTVRDRDDKGLYAKALTGEISDVVGIDIPLNIPQSPDLVLDANHPDTPERMARQIINAIPYFARALNLNKNGRNHRRQSAASKSAKD